jgi:Na+-translocating ferredoxin:NAD+ oxidoreductase subunit B
MNKEEIMENLIYQKLARHLDNLPGGFPATETGVELRILKRLFAPEEAGLALHLSLISEEPRVIARRAKISREEAADRLETMALKGLILREEPEKGPMKYMAAQYVVGIWEYQVNNLDPDLIRDMNEYLPFLGDQSWKVPQMRVIPVGQSITPENKVLPYEMAEELIREQKKFGVRPCICRREHTMVGKGCNKPEESCLVFGMGVDYDHRNGVGRVIDLKETLDIIKRADEAGLVLQPSNTKDALFICCCCGCCCQVLKSYKRNPKPVSMVSTSFVAAHNVETCSSCGVCVERCQMEALQLEADTISLNPDRCIGCGLCVSTCPTGSISLVRKAEQPAVPKDIVQNLVQLGKARGKITTPGLMKMMVKSKLDRLLTLSN